MPQRAGAGLYVRIVDDENWADDQIESFRRDESDELDHQGQAETVLEFDECAGGEVRVIGTVTASLLSNRRVKFNGDFRLYEGGGCSTLDPEGPGMGFQRVLRGNTRTSLSLRLPGDGGGSASGTIWLSNRNV